MSEFKFSCPSCSQNFKVDTSICAKKIECPSCHAKIIAPEAPKDPNVVPVATLVSAPPAAPAKTPATPATPAAPPAPATPATPAAPKESPAAPEPKKSDALQPRPQIAILTSGVVLEIVRSVRQRLAEKSHWLPRKNEKGEHNYAGRMEGDQVVPVEVESPKATHFSLLGACLREFHDRNVTRTATGRKRFLDTAITEATRRVIEESTGQAPASLDTVVPTYEQSLKILDRLERQFLTDSEGPQGVERATRIGNTRLKHLLMKLEGEVIITNEEIATALYHEIEEINARLAALEAKAGAGEAAK